MSKKKDFVVVTSWSMEDVQKLANERGIEGCTEEVAKKTLYLMKKDFDENVGYKWDTMENALLKALFAYKGGVLKGDEEYPEQIKDIWYIDDVRFAIDKMDCTFVPPLSDKECLSVLESVQSHFDANDGVTCQTIKNHTKDLFPDRIRESGLVMVNVTAHPYASRCGTIFVPARLRNDEYALDEYCDEHFSDVVFENTEYDYKGTSITYEVDEADFLLKDVPSRSGILYPETQEKFMALLGQPSIPLRMICPSRVKDLTLDDSIMKEISHREDVEDILKWHVEDEDAKRALSYAKKKIFINKVQSLREVFHEHGFSDKEFVNAVMACVGTGDCREHIRLM